MGLSISNDYINYLLESRSLVWLISRIIAHIFALICCIFLLTVFLFFILCPNYSWEIVASFWNRSTVSCDPNMLKTESISNSYWENILYISIIWYSVPCNMSKWCWLLSFFGTVFCFCLLYFLSLDAWSYVSVFCHFLAFLGITL